MALSNLSTIADIEAYLKSIILSVRPTANLASRTPLYDILIRGQAEIVLAERRNLDDVYRILRVLPLFGDDGSLLYPDMEEELLDRFMMAIDPVTRATVAVRLFFNKRCAFTIAANSYLSYSGISLEVMPAAVSENEDLWLQESNGWSYPIEIFTDTVLESQAIPVTTAWSLAALKVTSETGQVFQASNRTIINTTSTPALTLGTLKNSIANRSFSNARSLRNKLQSESAFRPAELLKNYIMRFSDVFFIDGYRIIGEDPIERGGALVTDRKRLIAKVSGLGKILLDYGVATYQAPLTLEYLPYCVDPLFAHTNPEIHGDTYQQIDQVILGGITMGPSGNTDLNAPGTLYATITEVISAGPIVDRKIQFHFFQDPACTVEVADTLAVDVTDIRHGYAAINPVGASGIYGGIYFSYSQALPDASVKITVSCLNTAVYRARVPAALGVLSPAALICTQDPAAMTTYAQAYQDKLNSKQVPDILLPHSTPAVILENSGFRIINDVNAQIALITLDPKAPTDRNPFTPYDVLNNQVYWKLTVSGGVTLFRLSIDPTFADPSKWIAEVTVPASALAYEDLTLTPLNNYRAPFHISFTVDAGFLLENISEDNRLLPDAEITAFSNGYVYLATRVNTGAANALDGKTAQLVYYGTNPEYLGDAQALLNSRTWVEIGNSVMVSPFRPISVTAYYDPEYIYPYIEARTAAQLADAAYMQRVSDAKTKYTTLQDALARYFSTYTGDVRSLDLAGLSRSLYDQTGLYVKRLDYTLATQRGYLVRGHIDISLDQKAFFNFQDISDYLEQNVDYTAPKIDVTQTIDTRESSVTVPVLYRYVFSKVRL